MTSTTRSGPLEGIRVLDLTSYFTGPFATALLADYGADVVKVEATGGGDAMRQMGTSRDGQSAPYVTMNRSKRSIELDLQSPDSQPAFRRLVERSDAVVQNFRPGVAERLGLDYDACREINPDVVHLSISGYGSQGPYARMPTFDAIVQGHTGVCYGQGNDKEPEFVRQAIVDKVTGLYASHALLAALLQKARGGPGQPITISMFDCSLAFHWADCMNEFTFLDGDVRHAPPMGSLYATMATRDGYVTVSPITDAQFWGYCRALGRDDLVGDARIDSLAKRIRERGQIRELRDTLRQFDTADICRRLAENDVPHGPVLRRDAVLDDDQVPYAAVHEIGEAGCRTRLVASPARFSGEPLPAPGLAPTCGQHTREILAELGLDGVL